MEVEDRLVDAGTNKIDDGGSTSRVDPNCQPPACSESGAQLDNGSASSGRVNEKCFGSKEKERRPMRKPAILRPKKSGPANASTSPNISNRPKKRSRIDPFNLNRFLGIAIFGDYQVEKELEEGEIRTPVLMSTAECAPNVKNLNSSVFVADYAAPCLPLSGDTEVDVPSSNHVNKEFEDTVEMGIIVGTGLGDHIELIMDSIFGEGNNAVFQ
ncbi:hypothetical protein L1987_29759 [Smallanthus sonchifolius]|uniref:Uncharacterized protein n=1 Tax=Smallanthus sonchifolius TaxID=185202 RepID=A0ACB9I0Z2_9ASTR|nr:hypothetical protein L1987_29759 [Smallanthus sonchifolius]